MLLLCHAFAPRGLSLNPTVCVVEIPFIQLVIVEDRIKTNKECSLLLEQRHHVHQVCITGIYDTFHASHIILQTTGLPLIHSLLRYGSSLPGCFSGLPKGLAHFLEILCGNHETTATTESLFACTQKTSKLDNLFCHEIV